VIIPFSRLAGGSPTRASQRLLSSSGDLNPKAFLSPKAVGGKKKKKKKKQSTTCATARVRWRGQCRSRCARIPARGVDIRATRNRLIPAAVDVDLETPSM